MHHEQLDEWREALRRSEKGVVYYQSGGCRFVLHNRKVLCSTGTASIQESPLELDSPRDRIHSQGRDFNGRTPGFHEKLRAVEAMTEEDRDEILSEDESGARWTSSLKAERK